MQLPDFIKRAMAFFEKAETNLTAVTELATAKARVAELEAFVKSNAETLATKDASIKSYVEQLTQANGELGTLQTAVTTLKSELEAAKGLANKVIATQGLALDQIPEADAKGTAAGAGETAWTKYNRLLATNPQAAGEFYRDNAAAILSSRIQG